MLDPLDHMALINLLQGLIKGLLGAVIKAGSSEASEVVITGVAKHLPRQAIGRGFTAPRILDIVRKGTPTKALGRYGPQTRYTLGANTVVVNDKGIIITVFSNAPGTRNGLGRGVFIP